MDSNLDAARAAVDRAVLTMAGASTRTEALGTFQPARRVLGVIPRAWRIVPLGRVWRLGVLLLDASAGLYAAGRVTRSAEPVRRGYTARSAEERAEFRAAAFRGRFPAGETVVFDARPIALDDSLPTEGPGPVLLRDGQVLVRWSRAASNDIDFVRYITERVDLLAHPPQGA